MNKRAIVIDLNKVDENMLNLIKELEQKGYFHKDGYLYYEDFEKEVIEGLFSKYGLVF